VGNRVRSCHLRGSAWASRRLQRPSDLRDSPAAEFHRDPDRDLDGGVRECLPGAPVRRFL